MPMKPLLPCKHPECPKLTVEQYCEEHKPLYQRESPSERGYNSKWNKARKIYLKAHPFCVRCKEKGKFTKATVVDHIIPHRGDSSLFWDRSNWQSLCKSCHDSKTATEDRNITYKY